MQSPRRWTAPLPTQIAGAAPGQAAAIRPQLAHCVGVPDGRGRHGRGPAPAEHGGAPACMGPTHTHTHSLLSSHPTGALLGGGDRSHGVALGLIDAVACKDGASVACAPSLTRASMCCAGQGG